MSPLDQHEMCEFFKGWRRTVGYAVLFVLVCYVATLYTAHRRTLSIAAKVRLDPTAFEAIDHSHLEKPLGEFLVLLETPGKVIGQPQATFPSLFQLALKSEELTWGRRYDFVLPVTEKTRQRLKRGSVPCWPGMFIDVDSKSQTIRAVGLHMTCL